MARLASLLDEYDLSHRHPTNIAIHWVAEPLAIFALMALAASVPLPVGSLLWPFLGVMLIYFGFLSCRLVLAMLPIVVAFSALVAILDSWITPPTLQWAAPLFAMNWVALLIGHKIEGRVPSVFQNPNLIFVGPAWLIRRLFRRFGQPDP